MNKNHTIPLELEGINRTIFEWAINSPLFNSIFGEDTGTEAILVKILGKEADHRELASLTLYQ